MDDCPFVHAIEFLGVNLVCVEHRRVNQWQALAAAEHRAFAGAIDAGKHIEDLATPRRRRAGYSNGEGIGDKRRRR